MVKMEVRYNSDENFRRDSPNTITNFVMYDSGNKYGLAHPHLRNDPNGWTQWWGMWGSSPCRRHEDDVDATECRVHPPPESSSMWSDWGVEWRTIVPGDPPGFPSF